MQGMSKDYIYPLHPPSYLASLPYWSQIFLGPITFWTRELLPNCFEITFFWTKNNDQNISAWQFQTIFFAQNLLEPKVIEKQNSSGPNFFTNIFFMQNSLNKNFCWPNLFYRHLLCTQIDQLFQNPFLTKFLMDKFFLDQHFLVPNYFCVKFF